MELLKNLEGLSADEQMSAVVELQKAAMKHLEEQKQASIGKSAELVIQGLKKIKSDFEAKFDSLNYDIQTKVASLKDGEQGLQGPKGDQGERGLDGSNGRDGRDGKDGRDGLDGQDGVGVRDAKIDFDGSLVITLTDGREINVGEVVSVDVAKQIQKVTHNIQTGAGGDSQTVLDAIATLQATIATYGTMATQNANNVAITGGAINNTTIGATTPSTGAFTTLVGNSTSEFGKGSANYFRFTGNTTGNGPTLRFTGSDSNIDGIYAVRGTGAHRFFTNDNNQQQFQIAHTASAVNYVQVTGAATGGIPRISTQGSDSAASLAVTAKSGTIWLETASGFGMVGVNHTAGANNYLALTGGANNPPVISAASGFNSNVPLLFQSKGTGAIDLAAGSSGVNISNGGTVTAITRTANGTGYTSIPSVAITAPTTAGGVQATATATMFAITATVQAGGTGYAVGNVLTVVGGTYSSQATFTVSAVSAGVVTAVTLTSGGTAYSVLPTNPVSTTGGTGTGATLNITSWGVSTIPVGTAGSGYVEQPTVTFSGGGGSGAAAYATVGSGTVVKSLGSTMSFTTGGGEQVRVSDGSGTSTGYLKFTGSTSNSNGVYLTSSANAMYLSASAGNNFRFFTNGEGIAEQLRVAHTASAVNYVQVTGAATGSPPAITVQGSDANIRMNISSKGIESVDILTNNTGTRAARFTYTASSVNWAQMTGSATGFGVVFSAQGSDANIPAVVQPKGTGALQAQQTDSTATGGNARGANAVDWQTSRSTSARIASAQFSVVSGGNNNAAQGYASSASGGESSLASGAYSYVGGGSLNTASSTWSATVGGASNTSAGLYNFVGGGFTNSGTSGSAVTTQSATMNGTTAVTLAASNASIKVGQYITGTSIAGDTYVAAVSGTSLTLSKNASGSSTSTLSFFTPHGVVVGGGNNQATGSYSFIGGGGDAGQAFNRNVASGDWSFVGGGRTNIASGHASVVVGGGSDGSSSSLGSVASGVASFIGGGLGSAASGTGSSVLGGYQHIANGQLSSILGGRYGNTRSTQANFVFPTNAIADVWGVSQAALLVLGRQTTDATPTVLASNAGAAGTTNQVILPNNSAYYFRGEIVSGVTGGGNTKGWFIEGVIKRGANAASTALVGTPTVTSNYADAGASTWTIAVTADTTNGGLAVTFTGQAATTIRTVAQIRTTEMTY